MLPIGRRPRRDRTTVLDGTDFTAAEWKRGGYDMAPIEAGGREADVRVLIVGDEPSLRQTVAEIVAQLGHEVIALGDAESAWRAYTAEPFSVLLLDWLLPGMDGLAFCQQVRAAPGGEYPIIVVMTVLDRATDLDAVLGAGADDYLAKPFDLYALETRLRIAEQR